jgi:hypothetical protein
VRTILRAGDCMQVEVDADTVLATPAYHLYDVSAEMGLRRTERSLIVRTHGQASLARNGSSGSVSIAQKGMGTRTQLRPAPAISAMSASVYHRVRFGK